MGVDLKLHSVCTSCYTRRISPGYLSRCQLVITSTPYRTATTTTPYVSLVLANGRDIGYATLCRYPILHVYRQPRSSKRTNTLHKPCIRSTYAMKKENRTCPARTRIRTTPANHLLRSYSCSLAPFYQTPPALGALRLSYTIDALY